jgi:hypothetical protein
MSRLALCFFLITLGVKNLTLNAQERGSVEAHQAILDAQRQSNSSEMRIEEYREHWLAAEKLKHVEITVSPAERHRVRECLHPQKLEDGSHGFLDYYLFEILDIVDSQSLIVRLVGSDEFDEELDFEF